MNNKNYEKLYQKYKKKYLNLKNKHASGDCDNNKDKLDRPKFNFNKFFNICEEKNKKVYYYDNDFDSNYNPYTNLKENTTKKEKYIIDDSTCKKFKSSKYYNYKDIIKKKDKFKIDDSTCKNLKSSDYCNFPESYYFDEIITENDMITFFDKDNILQIYNFIQILIEDLVSIGPLRNLSNIQINNLFNKLGLIRYNDNFRLKQSIFTKFIDSLEITLNLIDDLPIDEENLVMLLQQQNDTIDNDYISNPGNLLNIIQINIQNGIRCNFQHLFLLQHYLKRSLQDKFTDFLTNYIVINNNGEFEVHKGNPSYINFLMKNIISLQNFINANINDTIDEYFGSQSGINLFEILTTFDENIILNNIKNDISRQIKLIMKGGNVTKLYMNDFALAGNNYSIPNYETYLKNLSDFDFDIDFNIENPFDGICNEENLNLELNNVNNIIFLLKNTATRRIVFKLIKNYFSGPFQIPDDVKRNINCHIDYYNSLLPNTFILEKIEQNDYKYINPETEIILDQTSHQHSYFLDPLRYDIQNETSDSDTLSVTSSFNIGTFSTINSSGNNQNRFLNSFDLTRLQLRLKIEIPFNETFTMPIITKAEVFDFGYSHIVSSMSIHVAHSTTDKIFNLNIPRFDNYEIPIKDIKFILHELLHISIYTNDVKTKKRFIRLFTILQNLINLDPTKRNEVFTHICYSIKLLKHDIDYNFIDGIMYLFQNKYSTTLDLSTNMNNYPELTNSPIWLQLREIFQNTIPNNRFNWEILNEGVNVESIVSKNDLLLLTPDLGITN